MKTQFNRWMEIQKDDFPDSRIAFKKEVCPTCRGTGTTWCGRPSHDAIVFTQDDIEQMDPDEMDGWIRGDYDGICPECGGDNVIDVLDRERTDPDSVNSWDEWEADYYQDIAVQKAEMGIW